MSALTQSYTVNFGARRAGLTTVGWALYLPNGTASGTRSTSGVTELGGGNYCIQVTYDSAFVGAVVFDSGETTPAKASEAINLQATQALAPNAFDGVIIEPAANGGTQLNLAQALRLIAARSMGGWSRDPTTGNTTFYAAGNPSVPRGTFVETLNTLTVTVDPS